MSFGVGGLMSGLDTESIITQMMKLEQRPILLLQKQEAAYQAKISAFGALKGVLGELQSAAASLKSPDLFAGFSVSSANTAVLTASASDTAVAGTYQVTVDAVAQAEQFMSAGFATSSEVVGTGTLTIQVGANTAVDVTIDATNNTLAGIAQAINDANTDVTAGVINDGSVYRLTLVSKETGASNTISLNMSGGDGGLATLNNNIATGTISETTQPAGNAKLIINGIPVERASNTIDDLLEGVTLNVTAADPGNPFEVKVSRNVGSVITKITAFVDKYNNALASLGTLQASDLEAGKVGLLQGDSTPRILQMRLQSLLASKVDGIASSVNTLGSLGVSADKDGKLSLNPITFSLAYEANQEDVVNFFTQTTTGSEGFAVKFDSLLDSYLQSTTGLLVTKEEGLQRSIDHIGDQVERIQLRLAKREENMRRQFNALESLLAQFQNTSGVLNQQLEALSNLSSQIYSKK